MSNQQMNTGNSNPLMNIGTPSFSISQVPQHLLQSLTPAQLQMIQQKHQQLLLQRQRQAQQMQQEQIASPGSMNQMDAAQRAQLMKLKQQQMQRSQMQQSQMQQSQMQQLASRQTSPPNQSPEQVQARPKSQQQSPGAAQPQGVRSGLTLPPQIAQLSPPLQLQWLQSIKQQAIARNNQNALIMITQLEAKVQQQHQHQQQQQQQQQKQASQPVQPPQQRPIQMSPQTQIQQPQPQHPTIPLQQNMSGNLPFKIQKPAGLPAQQTIPVQPPQPSQAVIQQRLLQQFQSQLPEIPKFQTINQDPPETQLPDSRYWSSKEEKEKKHISFDTRLYEHIIERDALNKGQLLADTNGLEPISKFGLSQRELMLRLQQDLQYYKELKDSRMQSITNTTQGQKSKSIWGDGYSGYGNGFSNDITKIQVDSSNDVQLDKIHDWAINQDHEDLVPIRLEFDAEKDKFTLRDTFIWNRLDTLLSINDFVKLLFNDYKLSNNSENFQQVVNSVKEQIQDFNPDPFNSVDRFGGDDLRIKIHLDIVVGQHQLIDTIEWDISNPSNSPEAFAECLCEELSLPGEFLTAIAHSIREQVHMYHKSLNMVGYQFDGSTVEDDEIRSRLLPVITLSQVMRSQKDTLSYTPNPVSYTHLDVYKRQILYYLILFYSLR